MYHGSHTAPPIGSNGQGRVPPKVETQEKHVQTHSDRQSRRNRLPGHQDRSPHGSSDGRGLFRGRPRRSPCRDGRRGRADRPAGCGRELSGDREDRGGLPQDRRRGRASRLRLPVRARGVSARAGGGRHCLHRPQPGRDRGDGRQDRIQKGRREGQKCRPCPAISASSRTPRTRSRSPTRSAIP
ncbi:hypothetical protein ACVWXL_003895 [Bradyrhizobium sp. GM22.5]